MKGKKNLGGEAIGWRNGEISSQEAKITIFLSLCIRQNGPSHPAGLFTFSFGSNTWTWKLEYTWVRFQ